MSDRRHLRPSQAGPKRIALIASFAPSLMTFRSSLIRQLVRQGHEVTCLAPDFDPETRESVASLGARTMDYPLERRGSNPMADLKSLNALRTGLRAITPDVVMGYTPKPAIYGSIAAGMARVPRIVPMITGLGYAFLGNAARDRAIRLVTSRLYRRAFKASHAVVFHNSDDRDQLSRSRILPAGKPTYVVGGSGVDLGAFVEQPLPVIGDGLTFLMIARLLRYKGVVEYCEAARRVKALAPGARFLLIGPAESGPAGLGADDIAGWNDCVTYLGPQSDVRPFLAQCHVFVLPSHDGEGLPRTVLEALATGRPIITTNTRGCRETVDERVNGCLVAPGGSAELAEAMMSYLRRPDLIPAMARASRVKAERRFSVDIVNRQMIDALLGTPAHDQEKSSRIAVAG